jgi:hypothetical protein
MRGKGVSQEMRRAFIWGVAYGRWALLEEEFRHFLRGGGKPVGQESETHPAFSNWVNLKSCRNTFAPLFLAGRFFTGHAAGTLWETNDPKGGMRYAFPPYGLI